jgi:hypothetical protein
MSVREITGPILGSEESRSSFSRQAGEPHRIVNIGLDARELTLERLHEPADALLDAGIGPFLALPLGSDHVDDLAPAGDEIGNC